MTPVTTAADPVREQAFEWQVALWSGETSRDEYAAFERWLEADPAHAQAWEQIRGLDQRLQGLPRGVAGDLLRTRHRGASRRQVLRAISLVAGTGALAYAVRESPSWTLATADHHTARGERRQLALPDGTLLVLNTATAIDVHFDARERRISLRAGEAHITTAPDPSGTARPFLVETRHGSVRPVGTRFTVRLDAERTLATVTEGAVQLASRQAPDAAVLVSAGQQASFTDRTVHSPGPAAPMGGAWVRGLLVAEHMRLSDFLAELGRYRNGLLRCDEAVAGLQLSGVYPLEDTDRILEALPKALPVRVRRATRYWVTVGPA